MGIVLAMTRRALMSTALCAAFGLAGPPAWAATPSNSVVIGTHLDDLPTLDPAVAYESTGLKINSNVYDRLLRFEADDPNKLEPGIAESWTASDDGKTITLKIKAGLTFQSGAPITAEDAAFSLQRVVILNGPPSFIFTQLGWTKDNVTSNVVALDVSTLKITIPEGFAPSLTLRLLAAWPGSIVEKKAVMAHEVKGDLGSKWLSTHLAGSGAYSITSWKPNDSVTLEAFPKFRLGEPAVKRVILRHIPESSTQRLQLERGDLDIALDLTPDQIRSLAGTKGITVTKIPSGDQIGLNMSQKFEPWTDPDVLEAVRYAINYDDIADNLLKGSVFVNQSFLPQGFFGYVTTKPYKQDIAKAKAALAKSKYPNGFEVPLMTYSRAPFPDIAQAVQQNLAQIGIKATVSTPDEGQLSLMIRQRRVPLSLTEWAPDFLDPHSNAGAFYINPNNADDANIGTRAWKKAWVPPKEIVDAVMNGTREKDDEKRRSIYADLQNWAVHNEPGIWMFQKYGHVAARSNVKGFVFGLDNETTFFRKVTK